MNTKELIKFLPWSYIFRCLGCIMVASMVGTATVVQFGLLMSTGWFIDFILLMMLGFLDTLLTLAIIYDIAKIKEKTDQLKD